MARESSLEFRLMGGVGNQLFITPFAALFAMNQKRTRSVSLSLTELRVQSHSSGLGNLDLGGFLGESISIPTFTNTPLFVSRALDRTNLREIWSPNEVGYVGDPHSAIPDSAKVVRAYFQSSKYIEQLRELGAPLSIDPKSPSEEYHQAKSLLDWGSTAVIHVRRGDYVSLATTFGVLGWSYFSRAVDELKATGIENFVIMSDDVNVFETIKDSLPAAHVVNMADFHLKSAEEELALASGAAGVVMSNSSFSFWAAFGGRPKRIIYPSPWFRSLPEPLELTHSFSGFHASFIPSVWL